MTKKISIHIVFILICFFILTIGQFTPFEIGSIGISFGIYATIFFALPIVLYRQSKFLLSTLNNKRSKLIATITTVLLFALGTGYVPLLCFGKFMCGNITDRTLFTKHDIFNSRIVVRHYDFGAYDSSFPQEETVSTRNLFGFLNFVTKADTMNIDKVKWTRVFEK